MLFYNANQVKEDRVCSHCKRRFFGHPSAHYCSISCKENAYRLRRQERDRKERLNDPTRKTLPAL